MHWILLLAFLITGCSSTSYVLHYVDGKKAQGYVVRQVTMSDPHAFSPSHSYSWLELCQYTHKDVPFKEAATHQQYVDGDTVIYGCQKNGEYHFATTSGYADGLGSAALYSGAMLGGAALISHGLSQSGSTVTQGANTQTQSQMQSSQGFVPPGHAK